MRFFPNFYTVQSPLHGPIVVRQWGTYASVAAGGFEQSGPYVKGLWREALLRLPVQHAQRVLMVGLGGGCAIPEIEQRCTNASITVVELDPVIIAIACDLVLWKKEPEIIEGDWFSYIETAPEPFDVVLCDAFFSDHPEPRLAAIEYAEQTKKLLRDGGVLVVNASRAPEVVAGLQAAYPRNQVWQHRENMVVGCFL